MEHTGQQTTPETTQLHNLFARRVKNFCLVTDNEDVWAALRKLETNKNGRRKTTATANSK